MMTHWERHQHGVLGSVCALIVAQLVWAPETVLLLRRVVAHLVAPAAWHLRQQHVTRVAYICASELPLHAHHMIQELLLAPTGIQNCCLLQVQPTSAPRCLLLCCDSFKPRVSQLMSSCSRVPALGRDTYSGGTESAQLVHWSARHLLCQRVDVGRTSELIEQVRSGVLTS